MSKYIPFKENQSHILNDLTIENISDTEISMYGELNIQKENKEKAMKDIDRVIELLTEIKKAL